MPLAEFEEYIKCDTRKRQMLQKYLERIYSQTTVVQFCHTTVRHIPIYHSVFKRSKPLVTTSCLNWFTDSIETLKSCYLSTG